MDLGRRYRDGPPSVRRQDKQAGLLQRSGHRKPLFVSASLLNCSFSDHDPPCSARLRGRVVIYYYNKGFVCASDAPASIPFSPSRNRPNSSASGEFGMTSRWSFAAPVRMACSLGRLSTRTDIGRWHFEYEGNNDDDERLGPLSLTWKESIEEGGKFPTLIAPRAFFP